MWQLCDIYVTIVLQFDLNIDFMCRLCHYNSMKNKKGDNMNLFEKKKLILTEWDNSSESKKNFKKAVRELKKEGIPFIIVEKRLISELGKKAYVGYSVIMDTILLITVILALLNADKILNLLS